MKKALINLKQLWDSVQRYQQSFSTPFSVSSFKARRLPVSLAVDRLLSGLYRDFVCSAIHSGIGRTIVILIVLGLSLISCGTRQVLPPLEPEDDFERAMSFFENKKYDTAVQAFERILFYHPSSEYVDDAQYWLSRTYFEKKDYEQAIIEFDYLIRNFSTSIFLEDAHFYRAESYLLKAPSYSKDPTEVNEALSLFNQFLTKFPNSKYTDKVRNLILSARNRLAQKEVENGKLYVRLGEPDAALLYFEYVTENYPETDVSSEAKYYTATLYEKNGKIKEALELYDQLLEEDEWKEKAAKRIEEIEKRNAEESE